MDLAIVGTGPGSIESVREYKTYRKRIPESRIKGVTSSTGGGRTAGAGGGLNRFRRGRMRRRGHGPPNGIPHRNIGHGDRANASGAAGVAVHKPNISGAGSTAGRSRLPHIDVNSGRRCRGCPDERCQTQHQKSNEKNLLTHYSRPPQSECRQTGTEKKQTGRLGYCCCFRAMDDIYIGIIGKKWTILGRRLRFRNIIIYTVSDLGISREATDVSRNARCATYR
jgi:hypothetical protein